MSLRVCVLASGSSGNAVLVQGPEGTLLVDAGLTVKDLGRRLARVDCDPGAIAGVLVTHAHGDHVRGAGTLARRLGVPVWISAGAAREAAGQWRGGEELRRVRAGDEWRAAGLDIECWACPHDAAETLQFGFRHGGAAGAVCTDLGHATADVTRRLAGRHFLLVEANHDRERLLAGPYPWFLKRRILGERGHLSNAQCAGLLAEVAWEGLRRVVLGHLSRENNLPDLARRAAEDALVAAGAGGVAVEAADPDAPGPWLDVLTGRLC